jgi:hypothetical protein
MEWKFLNNFGYPLPKDQSCQVWLKFDKWFFTRDFFKFTI